MQSESLNVNSNPDLQTFPAIPPGFPATMAPPCIETNMAVESVSTSVRKSRSSPEKPIRNLSQAFEALCTDDIPNSPKAKDTALVSPTGVAELQQRLDPPSPLEQFQSSPYFHLHVDLQRDLTDHQVQRVSYYSLLHDINKEAATMFNQDPFYNQASNDMSPTNSRGLESPLIKAMMGLNDVQTEKSEKDPRHTIAPNTVAIIDEEQWLLTTISSRSMEETASTSSAHCPATFLQAMGEKEYENPVHAVTGHARTQLWKPSRSWWEAKSGKNPWIEPSSHNKRWRYLWPLIHYHKFLAKCIKKLKRNGVDVKHSVSPVAVFLREEVCAISDHLAAVSLFGSEEWMACLHHFAGWVLMTEDAESMYRKFVAQLPLRSIQEPGDVNSPLLRSQIDENFLRSMIAQREQMRESSFHGSKKQPNQVVDGASRAHPDSSMGPPPMYPRGSNHSIPKQIHGVRRPRYYTWWNGSSWEQTTTPPPPGTNAVMQDSSSVQSGLSADSYPHPPAGGPPPFDYNMYPMPPYYGHTMHPNPQPPHAPAGSDASQSTGYDSYNGMYDWSGGMDPNSMYNYHPRPMDGYYPPYSPGFYNHHQSMATTPLAEEPPQTPHVGQSESSLSTAENTQQSSPYWAHLDQATISMGLATPAKVSPCTPRRRNDGEETSTAAAQAPLVRQQYYGYAPYAPQDAYGPPSPATQFMMTPQASFAYKYGYGTPHRPRSTPRKKGKGGSLSPQNDKSNGSPASSVDHHDTISQA